jgi:nucleoside-diphosphate-sugar epimerase
MKKILVTGAAGFIGSNLVKELTKRKNFFVYALDVKNKSESLILNKIKNKNFKYIKKDFLKIKNLKFLPKKIDYIFHCASVVGVSKYMSETVSLIENNFYGAKKAINLALKKKSKIIFYSTSEIYGKNPKFPWTEKSDRVLGDPSILRWSYSTSKSLMEHYFFAHGKERGLRFSIIRPFNVYGPGQNPIFVVSSALTQIMKNKQPNLYDSGNQSRCFTYVEDIVVASIKIAISTKTNNKVYNVGINKSHKIKQVLQLCSKLLKFNKSYKKVNTKKIYGKLYEDVFKRIPCTKNLEKDINWTPKTNLQVGLRKTIQWIKENPQYLSQS